MEDERASVETREEVAVEVQVGGDEGVDLDASKRDGESWVDLV